MEPVEVMQRFAGRRIEALRKRRQWTQAELGQRIGKSKSTISRIEQGKQDFTFRDMAQLAVALGVEPREFFPPVFHERERVLREAVQQLLSVYEAILGE